jgi:hypothetical protein
MRRFYITVVLSLLLVLLGGCSNDSNITNESSPIVGKIFIADGGVDNSFDFEFVKFYDNKTFEGVHTYYYYDTKTQKNEPGYEKYYGTYEIEQSSITLKFSDNEVAGVISDDYKTIKFGNDGFTDWTEHIKDSDPLLSAFDK